MFYGALKVPGGQQSDGRERANVTLAAFRGSAAVSDTVLGSVVRRESSTALILLKPTGHVLRQQFNIRQLYALPTLYLCVLYLSENKQRLVPFTA